MSHWSQRVEALIVVAASVVVSSAWAQSSAGAGQGSSLSGTAPRTSASSGELKAPELTLAQNAPATQRVPPRIEQPPPDTTQPVRERYTREYRYREISEFFNVREAYADVHKGEWEFETEFEWETKSGKSDDFGPGVSLKYGVTDTFFAELELLPLILGEGDHQGNGDVNLILFNEFWKETDCLPAFGAWLKGRFPTGQGSSGVDGELHFNFTKQVATNCRAHLEGFVMTANGGRGDEDINRRDFQWGAGPGFDYSFSDDTILAVNYLNRVGEQFGDHNQNIVEFGLAQRIAPNQHLKFAVDVGVDGQESTPNFVGKVLWSIDW